MVELKFKDGTSANTRLLGSTEVNGQNYAVFFDDEDKSVYVYKYQNKKRGKYKLYAIEDKKEFRSVCSHLSSLIV